MHCYTPCEKYTIRTIKNGPIVTTNLVTLDNEIAATLTLDFRVNFAMVEPTDKIISSKQFEKMTSREMGLFLLDYLEAPKKGIKL